MDLSPFSLAGKKVLITGGGRGIGRACAEAMAQAGADLTITSRTQEQLDQTAAAITARGGRVSTCRCDIADAEASAKLSEEIGQLDVLVNNAGISPAFMMFTYGVPTISAMMKAAAPMTGGMICPPVDTTASIAPAW